MNDLELLHFGQLKSEVQTQYLKNHSPSFDEISKWKGIDIIYFQEDLRKIAKGNISEKTFYTYFKSQNIDRLPRIDMLNILSIYAGYVSWYDFKKNHLFADEILIKNEEIDSKDYEKLSLNENNISRYNLNDENLQKIEKNEVEINDLQINKIDYQLFNENSRIGKLKIKFPQYSFVKKYIWLSISSILAIFLGLLGFKDVLFNKKFYYSFIDADRNSKINAELQVQILKTGESPILYVAKPNETFVYTTKSKLLTMVVSSPYYKTDTIHRNLETAPEAENIELKPNDYAIMLFYYSKSIKDLKKKRERLDFLISNNVLIYQVFDNEFYGVETMDKQRYISFVTLPTTSLENLEVIDTKTDKNGKINMIKFRIANHEKIK